MDDFYNSKFLSIIDQDKRIKEKFPKFVRRNNYKEGIWIGNLQPTKWSDEYKIKIRYIKKAISIPIILGLKL